MKFGHNEAWKAQKGPLFNARWAGTCNDCGEDFEEGDRIGYVDDVICCYDCWRDQ